MLDGYSPWPTRTAERYRALGYWRGENLSALLRAWACRFTDHTALVHEEQRLTYADLDRRVDRLAAGLRHLGLRPGDRVVVQLPNAPEFVLVCFALFRIDVKPVFSLMAHRASEIEHLCALSGAVGYVIPGEHRGFRYTELALRALGACPDLRTVIVADGVLPDPTTAEDHASAFVDLRALDADPVRLPEPDASDVAFFLLSGGTTALPKLIPRTHDDYAYQTRTAAEINGLSENDVYLAALPLEFNFTWGCPGVIGTLGSGGTVVLAHDPDPTDCFDLIEREQVTVTSVVPTVAHLWMDTAEAAGFDGSSLRLIQIGGAPLHREIAERVTPTFGCQLQQVFGMAEGLLSFTRPDDPPESVVGTQGRPISPGDEIRIVDDTEGDVPQGANGELLTRGPYTLRGYYRAAQHNARAFTPDGFYRTGDLARLTENGDLVIEGRIKDVIIRGGTKISAPEVEGLLLSHPSVARVAVVPIPDPYLGERICAYVQPAGEPPTLQDLRDALRERDIAEFKLPDRLEIVDALPLTGLGKIDKKLLAKDAAARCGHVRP